MNKFSEYFQQIADEKLALQTLESSDLTNLKMSAYREGLAEGRRQALLEIVEAVKRKAGDAQ